MTNEHIGMFLSLCGMAITIFSFQAKEKKQLLILQSIGTVFYLISYIFSNGGVAIWLNCIFVVRNFIYMYADKRTAVTRYIVCALLCAAYVAVYAISVIFGNMSATNCMWSILPIIGAFFGTVAFANTNVNKLRILKSCDSAAWLVYNSHIGIGALGGILGEILNIISIVVALFRYSEKRQNKKL